MFGNSPFGFSGAGGGGGGTIGGGGTLNYLCKFTPDGLNIGNSMFFDNGISAGLGTITPDASALLDLTSTTQGFLSPRMTTIQRDAIITPVNALLIYNTTTLSFNYYNGLTWIEFSGTVIKTPFAPSNTAIVVGDDFQEVAEKSQGQINDIVTNVTTLQNNEYKITYFAEINAATGTITKPTGSTILLDQFAGGVDAYVSTITNGQPTGDFPETAGGVLVDVASFDASGNFVLSGTPSAYPCALIYIVKISAADLSNALISNRLDLEDINIVKATQSTVDAGTNDNQFVTPYTFTNAAKWALYQLALTAANFGSFINGLTDKATPVDTDYIPLMDSADSNNTKKLSWANLKTTLAILFGRHIFYMYSDTSSVSPPDNSVYYTSVLNAVAVQTTNIVRFVSPKNNCVFGIQVGVYVAGTLGSSENTVVKIQNVTAGTEETLNPLQHNKRYNQSYTMSTLANTAGDEMIVQITNPAWATNPSSCHYQFTTFGY